MKYHQIYNLEADRDVDVKYDPPHLVLRVDGIKEVRSIRSCLSRFAKRRDWGLITEYDPKKLDLKIWRYD